MQAAPCSSARAPAASSMEHGGGGGSRQGQGLCLVSWKGCCRRRGEHRWLPGVHLGGSRQGPGASAGLTVQPPVQGMVTWIPVAWDYNSSTVQVMKPVLLSLEWVGDGL